MKLLKDRKERAKAKAAKTKELEAVEAGAEKPVEASKKRKSDGEISISEVKHAKKAKRDENDLPAANSSEKSTAQVSSEGKKHLSESKLQNKVKNRQQSARRKIEKSGVGKATN